MSTGNWIKLSSLSINKANPRTIKKAKVKALVRSLLEFPQMLKLRGIVVDSDGTILGGNMRFLAIQEIAKMTDEVIRNACHPDSLDIWLRVADSKSIPAEWVVKASELTDAQKKRFMLADNVLYGEWDVSTLLAGWSKEELIWFGPDLNYAYFYGEAVSRPSDDNQQEIGDVSDLNAGLKEEEYSSVIFDIKKKDISDFLTEITPIAKKYGARYYAQ